MSYELADGTMSTDYKIGDRFTSDQHKNIFTLEEDDGSNYPFFDVNGGGVYGTNNSAYFWYNLTPIKQDNNTKLIEQLRKTIKQLKATIKELEQ